MDANGLRFSYIFMVVDDSSRFFGQVWDQDEEEAALSLGTSPSLAWLPITPEPWKLYARVTLARADHLPSVSVAFTIDRGLMTVLRAGDLVYLRAVPALGLSIVRDGRLIAAAGDAGALARLPLGDLSLRFPDPADAPRPVRWMGDLRVDYLPVRPVEISVGAETTSRWWGRPTIGSFDVLIRRGRDREPLLSFERRKVCPETAAHTSAELMERHGLEICMP